MLTSFIAAFTEAQLEGRHKASAVLMHEKVKSILSVETDKSTGSNVWWSRAKMNHPCTCKIVC